MEPENYISIKNWSEQDRPREKMQQKGKAALSDAELLAILLGSGTTNMSAVELAQQILASVNHNLHELAKLSLKDLEKFKGIGEAKAITIAAALELGRRRKEAEPLKKSKITCSQDAYDILYPHLLDLNHEQFWIILLNRANEVIKPLQMSAGGLSATVVDAKLIFKATIDHEASGIVLAHNHPSGNAKPSTEDMKLTEKLKQGGALIDIAVLDHIIFTNHAYFSFADEGLI